MELTAATILILLVIAAFAPALTRLFRRSSVYLFALFPFILFIQFILHALQGSPTQSLTLPWVPALGLTFSLRLDGLATLMGLLVSGIGFLVLLYAGDYLNGNPSLGKFYAWLLTFMGSMLGLVVAGNALLLFIFWELTSLSSFFLIGFENNRPAARAAAWQALLVTGGGGLALLTGLILLGQAAGTYDLAAWAADPGRILAHPLAIPAFLLVFLGAMTKSAQFPFHFWLPNAMEAPTPVSAYLHSATMVKAGVYLLMVLFPVLSGLPLWRLVLPWVGMLTFLTGALLTLAQADLKRLLAYSTVTSLGVMVFLLGLGHPLGLKTALVFLVAHSLYKGALFLVAGGIDHAVHTRNLNELGGLAKSMPLTAAAAGLAALSMAGFPPLLGYLAKELFFDTAFRGDGPGTFFTFSAVAGSMALAAAAGWVGLLPFLSKVKIDRHAHEVSFWLWFAPLVLALAGALLGIFPHILAPLIQAAINGLLALGYEIKLSLWHGFTPVLAMSIITLLGGALLYAFRTRFQPALAAFWHRLAPGGPAHLYHTALKGLLNFAAWVTRILQNGYLRVYIAVVIVFTLALSGLTFAVRLGRLPNRPGETFAELWGIPRFYDVGLVLIILMAAFLVTRTASRLATIALLGSIGFSIALLFLLYSAPDLAMVQFAIETLTVILFILVIYRLPRFNSLSSPRARALDIVIALSGGVLMTILMLLVSTNPAESQLAAYFAQNSLPLANGRNIVNVILVDFRSLDTLGEITVLATAAIGVSALLRLSLRRQSRKKS